MLKQAVLNTLLSLLEGNCDPSIPRHMLRSLDFVVIENNLVNALEENHSSMTNEDDRIEYSYFFLLCTLNDYDTEKRV